MDRRAELTFNQIIMTFFRLTMLFLVCGVFVFFVSSFWNMKLATEEVEAELFSQAIINSQKGVSWTRDGQVYPGVVSVDLFRQPEALGKQLEDAFSYGGKRPIAAKIELKVKEDLKPVYYNKELYDVWYPLGKTLVPGLGGAYVLEKNLPVIARDGSKNTMAALKITVAVPRS